MSLLTLGGITKYFGALRVLDDVSFAVFPKDRIGLVGHNGGGKTTLLNILARKLRPDGGDMFASSGLRVRLLDQAPKYDGEKSVWEHARSALADVHELEARLRWLENQMEMSYETVEDLDRLLATYARTEELYRQSGGYEWEVSVSATLTGLGFTPSDFGRQMGHLSSGQRIRVALARVLLEEADLLLLDEPTNHLDVHAAEWLEGRLRAFGGAVITVSHDKFLLNAICNRIFELEQNRLFEYKGNYDSYKEQLAFRMEQDERQYKRATQEAERLKEYIRRYKAGERSTMAKSREKRLARMAPIRAPRRQRHFGFGFRPASDLGTTVFRATGLTKKYDGQTVFSNVDVSVMANTRLGIIGKNGAGKTTLLKILMGIETPSSGEVWTGPSVTVGHFWQELDVLNPENTVLQELMLNTPLLTGEARSILGRFLFTADDVYKSVSVLSGGEKSRLTLAKLVVSGCNVLMLDEPTNHLDIDSKEALISALVSFRGAVVFITHDRQFLDECATQILEIEDGSAYLYSGNYSFYKEEKQRMAEPEPTVERSQKAHRPEKRAQSSAGGDPIRRRLRREAHEKALEDIQTAIEGYEKEKLLVEARLADAETYLNDGGTDVLARYREIQAKLNAKYKQWEALEANPPD